MKTFKHFTSLVVVITLLLSTTYAHAANGYAYQESRNTSYVTAGVGLGAVIIATILTIALSQTHGHNAHSVAQNTTAPDNNPPPPPPPAA